MPNPDPFFFQTMSVFSDDLRDAVIGASMPGLINEPSNASLAEAIKAEANQDFGKPGQLPPLVISGLWLLAGDLDRSHRISQDEPSADGSFWHGIMHRREADYSNAKYWFRRVGKHPVFDELQNRHSDVFSDPYEFVDRVETACRGRSGDASITRSLIEVQWAEWQLLIRHALSHVRDDDDPLGTAGE